MIKSQITDGGGRGSSAKVEDNALLVSVFGCPPLIPQKNRLFGQMFTDDGTTTGSNDLGVDGSTTSIDYYIPCHDENDRYITRLSIICGYGASAPLYDFVDSGDPLTNGIRIAYNDTYGNSITIGNPKNNYSFLRLGLADGIIPTGWELRNLGAVNDYGFIVGVDLLSLLPPYGIKIDRATHQRMTITIRDDCTDADIFNCRAFGFERFE